MTLRGFATIALVCSVGLSACGPRPDADDTDKPSGTPRPSDGTNMPTPTGGEATHTPTALPGQPTASEEPWSPTPSSAAPTHAPITGEGPLTITPGGLSLLSVPVGCSRQGVLSVENSGDELISITQVLLSSDLNDGVSIEGGPVALYPMDTVKFNVVYQPNQTEQKSGSVVILTTGEPDTYQVPLEVSSQVLPLQTDFFEQTTGGRLDLLWLMDTSPSMQDDANEFMFALSSILEDLLESRIDYHVAVLTSRVADHGEFYGEYGEEKSPFITSEMGEDGVIELLATLAELSLSSEGGNDERTFDNLGFSLEEELLNGHNKDFFRSDTPFVLFGLSDEDDHSFIQVDQLSDKIITVVPEEQVSGLFFVAKSVSGSGACSSERGERWIELARDFELGVEEICYGDFEELTLEFIEDSNFVDLKVRFLLSEPANAENSIHISMTYEGSVSDLSSGWSYESESHSIVFQEAFAPPIGSTLSVEYQPASSCE